MLRNLTIAALNRIENFHLRRKMMLRLLFPVLLTLLLCSSPLFADGAPMWIHVCDDGGAGGYDAFPGICRLQDGRLVCVFKAGYWHISPPSEKFPKGGRIVACYSSDEGNTWTAPQIIYDSPIEDGGGGIVQLDDGRILLTMMTEHFPVPGEWNRDVEINSGVMESADNGKTWSEPRFLFKGFPGPGVIATYAPIRILSDGTLLMPLYTVDDKNPATNSGAVCLSHDDGKTWGDVIIIPNGGRQYDAETDVIELKDGTLYAIQRPKAGSMAASYSKDKGKTWSVSEEVGFPGHCPNFLRTKDDVILLATRIPATMLRISRDECKTWSEPIKVDDVGGAYPGMVELKDGSILIVYYENDGAWGNKTRVHIRAKKFNVTDSGVEWLPFE